MHMLVHQLFYNYILFVSRLESLEMSLANVTHERDSLSDDKAALQHTVHDLETELTKYAITSHVAHILLMLSCYDGTQHCEGAAC